MKRRVVVMCNNPIKAMNYVYDRLSNNSYYGDSGVNKEATFKIETEKREYVFVRPEKDLVYCLRANDIIVSSEIDSRKFIEIGLPILFNKSNYMIDFNMEEAE